MGVIGVACIGLKNEVNDSSGSRLDHSGCFTLGGPNLHSLFYFFFVFCHGKYLVSHDTLQEIFGDYELVSIRLGLVDEEVFVGNR